MEGTADWPLQTGLHLVGEDGKIKTTRVLHMNEAQRIRRTYMRFGSASEAEAISPSVLAVSFGKRSCRNTFPLPGVDMHLGGGVGGSCHHGGFLILAF